MKNEIQTIPFDQLSTPEVKTATWKSPGGCLYTFAPGMDWGDFQRAFPDHKRVNGMLDSSGSSWLENAYLFYTEDCYDPPVYVQFGITFEDAHESFCDNDESLIIDESAYGDYCVRTDNPTCGFTSDGQPIDTEAVRGFELSLVSVTFT